MCTEEEEEEKEEEETKKAVIKTSTQTQLHRFTAQGETEINIQGLVCKLEQTTEDSKEEAASSSLCRLTNTCDAIFKHGVPLPNQKHKYEHHHHTTDTQYESFRAEGVFILSLL